MKKFITTLAFTLVAIISASATTYKTFNIDTDNAPIHEAQSLSNTDYWVTFYNIIQDAQKTSSSDKVVIKHDGKWKYAFSTPENLIQFDIILTHLTSGAKLSDGSFQEGCKKALDIAIKDKLIVVIR